MALIFGLLAIFASYRLGYKSGYNKGYNEGSYSKDKIKDVN